jgi:hypothetical protein
MDHENVVYGESVRGSKENFPTVQRLTSALAEMMGEWFPMAKVEWDRLETGRIGELYSLSVEMPDWGLGGQIRFTPQEMMDKHTARVLLHQMWGGILREYNHQLIRELATHRG